MAGVDTLEVNSALFKGGLAPGVDLTLGQLASNTTGLAGDADDRFILNSVTGELFYGINGSRLVAEFTGVIPALTAADFDIA